MLSMLTIPFYYAQQQFSSTYCRCILADLCTVGRYTWYMYFGTYFHCQNHHHLFENNTNNLGAGTLPNSSIRITNKHTFSHTLQLSSLNRLIFFSSSASCFKMLPSQLMNITFYLLGGIVYSTRISWRVKMLWTVVNLITATFTCASTFLYIFRIGQIHVNTATFFHIMASVFGLSYRCFAIGLTCYCRNDLEKIIHILSQTSKLDNITIGKKLVNGKQKMDTGFTMTSLIIISLWLLLLYLCCRPLQALFIARNTGAFHNHFYYTIPWPYIDKINSMPAYLIISLMHIIVSLPDYAVYLFLSTFILAIAFELYDEFWSLNMSVKQNFELLGVAENDCSPANISSLNRMKDTSNYYTSTRNKNLGKIERKIIRDICRHRDLVR